MIHYFLVDYRNSGDYYRFAVESSNKNLVEQFLMSVSSDVRFLKSKSKKNRNETGSRKIPGGIIVACNFYKDKVTKFGKDKKSCAKPDSRHKVVA